LDDKHIFITTHHIIAERKCINTSLLYQQLIMSSPPVLEPPELPEINSDPQQALLALVQQLKDGQSEQTALIQKLNKTVLTSRTLINELITAQTDMKEELAKLRSSNVSGECQVCNNKRDAAVAMSAVASVGQTTDDLIATLIEGRT